LLNYIKEIIK